ncbi:MAG: hypothetical protein ACM3US_07330 [Sphingomonadaceae bacterium]
MCISTRLIEVGAPPGAEAELEVIRQSVDRALAHVNRLEAAMRMAAARRRWGSAAGSPVPPPAPGE